MSEVWQKASNPLVYGAGIVNAWTCEIGNFEVRLLETVVKRRQVFMAEVNSRHFNQSTTLDNGLKFDECTPGHAGMPRRSARVEALWWASNAIGEHVRRIRQRAQKAKDAQKSMLEKAIAMDEVDKTRKKKRK